MTRIQGYTLADAIAHQARIKARPMSLASLSLRNDLHAPPSEKPSPARPMNKYRARSSVDREGRAHQSGAEARRWADLQLLEKAGAISGLQHQPKFDLRVNGQLVCRYFADSRYARDGHEVVEDVKSPATRKNRAYRIKVKLMKAVHSITISEYPEIKQRRKGST
jgi:hypothetical protein